MAKITLLNDDSVNVMVNCDLIMTDPPFDMPAMQLNGILNQANCNHLVLITTMKQLIDLIKISDWQLAFDFVLDAVVLKKSKNLQQPHYTHATGVYLTRNGAKSIFNRKLRQRSDTFDNNGYWPSIIRAPRERLGEHGLAKNQQAIIDLLGSFDVEHVYDPFAGSGTVGWAAFELDVSATLVEKDAAYFRQLKKAFHFVS
jgi:16S rRNA G966 N2-methylase RsmD